MHFYFKKMKKEEKLQLPLTFMKKKIKVALAHFIAIGVSESFLLDLESQIYCFVSKKINLWLQKEEERLEFQKKEIEEKGVGKQLCYGCNKLLPLYDFEMEGGEKKKNCWRHLEGEIV